MEEEWKIYKEVNIGKRNYKVYEVSNLGGVKVNGIITEPHISPNGYKYIAHICIHRAVAELFIPNPENKPCIDHIDTNKANNRVDNLRWVTHKENNNNPITRKHKSETNNRPEVRQKQSEVIKKSWENPEVRQKHIDAQNRPETKKKKSESLKVTQNRTETKQKISEASKDRTWINKNNIRKKVKTDQLSLFLNKGWKLGRK